MNLKIMHYLPFLLKGKDMIVYAGVSILLVIGTFMATGSVIESYQSAQDIQQQVVQMQTFLTEWSNKTNFLNNESYRPVMEDQVDSVQSNLLLNLQANSLELTGFKSVKPTEAENKDKNFEMVFKGSYENTMKYLNAFHAKDALISIRNLKMQPEKGAIVTTIQYKIYVFK